MNIDACVGDERVRWSSVEYRIGVRVAGSYPRSADESCGRPAWARFLCGVRTDSAPSQRAAIAAPAASTTEQLSIA